ncbi:hypothetical protein [Streptomyces sp. H27-C3]|uniref:hypothetical protein n=1 Tax=Streptomyces sp. H27-C3 TaxID=3046305 RepID=UPI0032D9427B
MTDNPDDTPTAGTKTSLAAADDAEKVSSELYDLIGVKGKASKTGPGVSECSGQGSGEVLPDFPPVEPGTRIGRPA